MKENLKKSENIRIRLGKLRTKRHYTAERIDKRHEKYIYQSITRQKLNGGEVWTNK